MESQSIGNRTRQTRAPQRGSENDVSEAEAVYQRADVDFSDERNERDEAMPAGAVATTLRPHAPPADPALSPDSILTGSAESNTTSYAAVASADLSDAAPVHANAPSHFEHLSENAFEVAPGTGAGAALASGVGIGTGADAAENAASAAPSKTPEAATPGAAPASATETQERGHPLPGDRGPREKAAEPAARQRPSFWRRIALGRRGAQRTATPPPAAHTEHEGAANAPNAAERATQNAQLAGNTDRAIATSPGPPEATGLRASELSSQAIAKEMLEKQVVEPMLQALVSVEAKLERSHADLTGRSDQIEQRLTQLWDIEEQLGTLGELQESLLQVSEQQRRLENALVAQTRSLRWLIGGVFFAITAAAFVVAAVLR
jgi:hypothetical protein